MTDIKNDGDRLNTVIEVLSIAFHRYKSKEMRGFQNKQLDLTENVSTNGLISNQEEKYYD